MTKRHSKAPCQARAIDEFLLRVVIERDRLIAANHLDKRSIFKVDMPTSETDTKAKLVDTYLEDMYHHLYYNELEDPTSLKTQLIAAGEVCIPKAENLIPLIDAMYEEHLNCIETLRVEGEWPWEKHGKAFEKLQISLDRYRKIINQTIADTPQPPAKKVNIRKNRSKKVIGTRIDSDLLIIGVLNKHHQYENGSCLNSEPIGCRELARRLSKAAAVISHFFKKEFEGHCIYKIQCQNGTISQSLRLLNAEVSPSYISGKQNK